MTNPSASNHRWVDEASDATTLYCITISLLLSTGGRRAWHGNISNRSIKDLLLIGHFTFPLDPMYTRLSVGHLTSLMNPLDQYMSNEHFKMPIGNLQWYGIF